MVSFEQGFYAGEFRHSLDAKKRLTIPSKWRFSGDEQALYLAFPDPSGCITVYPPEMVAKLKEKVSQMSMGDRDGQRAILRIMSKAETCTIDKNGRINLNDRLFTHACVDKTCVLVGTVNKFSIWSPERYETYLSGDDEGEDIADILGRLGL